MSFLINYVMILILYLSDPSDIISDPPAVTPKYILILRYVKILYLSDIIYDPPAVTPKYILILRYYIYLIFLFA